MTETAIAVKVDPLDIFDLFMGFCGGAPILTDADGRDRSAHFRGGNVGLAERAVQILDEEHPMTLRQLFYRIVSAGVIPNEPRQYKRLGRVATRLRELGIIPLSWLVDHLRQTIKPSSWMGLEDFSETVRNVYRKDLWASQAVSPAFFVEKDAVAGTLQPITEKYDVPLHVCRGYASISFAGQIAEQWGDIDKPVVAYYLGDFDPSGFDIERDLRAKLRRYGRADFEWTRLAVRPDDFEAFNIIPLPVKRTDTRARAFVAEHGRQCAELDALPPSELRDRVETAILSHVDREQWSRLQHIEGIEREAVQELFRGIESRFGKGGNGNGRTGHRRGAGA